jgi:ATP-dependent RNA helicase DeaD
MLYEGKVVSLEEGQTGDREGSERKPQPRASGGEVNDRRPAWKSKAEYIATLKPEPAKQEQAKLHPAKPRPQTDRKSTERKPSDKSQIQPAPGIAPKSPVKPPVKPAKVKADRERDRKNKGAPKWLKEKRETPSGDNK